MEVRATKVIYISEDIMDMEWEIPTLFHKAKALINEGACIKLCDETNPLYLETDESHIRLGAAILQIRNEMNCPQDKASHNSI